jgi:superfamily II DNA or RNA helicase
MATVYEYGVEIDENAPRAIQPEKIIMKMKDHQLACLQKAIMMERTGEIKYDIKTNLHVNVQDVFRYNNNYNNKIKNKVTVNTNIGILGDIVGYGKTLTALSIIAGNDDMHINHRQNVSFCSTRNYSYMSYSTENGNILPTNQVINSTLVIVPRGPVYVQWQKSIERHTTLKCLAIDNLNYIKKHLPEYKDGNVDEIVNFFNQYDLVLIKNTTLDVLFSFYSNRNSSITSNTPMDALSFIKRWKRVMIDEAHDISNKISLLYYEFIWLISGTYENILYSSRSYNNILYHIKDAVNYNTINLVLVKGTKDFVRSSFKIPVPIEKKYLCKLNAKIDAIKKFINPEILEKINANDILGAVRDLGGKNETEDSVIELVTKEIKRDIQNRELEREYTMNLDIPADTKTARLKIIDNDIETNKQKLEDLTKRLSELDKKMCSICMFEMENPIMLECTHSYCGVCIVKWLEKNMNCPECRSKIDMNKLIAIKKIDSAADENINEIIDTSKAASLLSKEDTLLKIIQEKPHGKFLVFSKYDSGFYKLMQTLNNNSISCSELKGHTSHMINVLNKFKAGDIKVILLNTNFAGSGIDISYATDVIIYHNMGLAKYQAIGRAQRVGRNEVLKIHHLCYDHELNTV